MLPALRAASKCNEYGLKPIFQLPALRAASKKLRERLSAADALPALRAASKVLHGENASLELLPALRAASKMSPVNKCHAGGLPVRAASKMIRELHGVVCCYLPLGRLINCFGKFWLAPFNTHPTGGITVFYFCAINSLFQKS